MGADKKTTESTQTRTVEPTAEEKRLNEIQLGLAEDLAPGQKRLGLQMQDTVGNILGGGQGLPDEFNRLFSGITPELTDQFANEAIKDIMPSFQSSGILDSGVAASIAAETSGDIRKQVAESNLTRLMNLLNTGLGFGGQQQNFAAGQAGQIGTQLAGLRGSTVTGTQTETSMNPFLKSFQTSLGEGLGNWTNPTAWMGKK